MTDTKVVTTYELLEQIIANQAKLVALLENRLDNQDEKLDEVIEKLQNFSLPGSDYTEY